MTMRSRSLLLLVALTTTSCVGSLTTVAPLPPASPTSYEEIKRPAQGWGCGVLLFNFIPIGVNERAEKAYQRALESVAATTLIDVRVTERWSWIFVGFKFCTRIDATGLRPARTAK